MSKGPDIFKYTAFAGLSLSYRIAAMFNKDKDSRSAQALINSALIYSFKNFGNVHLFLELIIKTHHKSFSCIAAGVSHVPVTSCLFLVPVTLH